MSKRSANRRKEGASLDGLPRMRFLDHQVKIETGEHVQKCRSVKPEDIGLGCHKSGAKGSAEESSKSHSSDNENLDISSGEDDGEDTTRMAVNSDSESRDWHDTVGVCSASKEGACHQSAQASPENVCASRQTSKSTPSTAGNGVKRSATSTPAASTCLANQSCSTLLSMIHEDILTNVIAFIQVSEISKVSCVSRSMARICQCETVWRDFCRREHGPDLPRLLEVYDEVLHTGEPELWKRTYRAILDYKIELHFFTGPRQGEIEKVELNAEQECMMGRSRKNNICVLQDEMVSRTHAKLCIRNHRYHIVDLGSINGTCINNVLISSHVERRLRLNEEVEMGNSTFRVDVRSPIEYHEEDEEETNTHNTDDEEVVEDHE